MIEQALQVADPRLAEAVRRLIEAMRPEQIYLFGSQASGEATADSDYDLLVVVASSALPPHQRAQAAYRALFGVGIPVDVLVLTRAEFERQAVVIASLPATVAREGQLLYAA